MANVLLSCTFKENNNWTEHVIRPLRKWKDNELEWNIQASFPRCGQIYILKSCLQVSLSFNSLQLFQSLYARHHSIICVQNYKCILFNPALLCATYKMNCMLRSGTAFTKINGAHRAVPYMQGVHVWQPSWIYTKHSPRSPFTVYSRGRACTTLYSPQIEIFRKYFLSYYFAIRNKPVILMLNKTGIVRIGYWELPVVGID